MGTLLIRNATVVVAMDAERREIADGGLFVRDGFIAHVGRSSALPSTADELLDLSGHLVLPGLVNTHHHLSQTLTRGPRRPKRRPVYLVGHALPDLGQAHP
jgi:8-oxoguanine deaminase